MALQFPSPFKLEFTLKQHTPIIHFQHDQAGATLRATEVKPKLDRFILTTLGKGDYNAGVEKAKKSKWFIGDKDDSRALNYKLRFIAPSTKQDYVIASTIPKPLIYKYENEGKKVLANTPYFANNEQIKDDNLNHPETKLGILHIGEIKAVFDCSILSLKEMISKLFPILLATENFGLRQNKAFGCFYIKNKGRRDFEKDILNRYKQEEVFSLRSDSLEQAYKTLDTKYKILKSGINPNPSELNLYAKRNAKTNWEKDAIKNILVNKNITFDTVAQKSKYLRALLGVAELYEFQSPDDPTSRIKIKIKGDNIDRYKSPLTFKIFQDGDKFFIYLIIEKINDDIYGQSFSFCIENTKEELRLDTPNKESLPSNWLVLLISELKYWSPISVQK